MPFIPLEQEEAKVVLLEVAATTFTKGHASVHDGSGQMTEATAGNGTAIHYVISEGVSSTATAGDLHSFWRADPSVTFIADTTGTPTQAQCGNYVDLVTDAGTLDTSASTDDLFFVERLWDSANNQVVGFFTAYTPNVE